MAHRIPEQTPVTPDDGAAPARRITFLALVILGAGGPLLPTTSLKVAATLSAALVLAGGWYARFRAGDPLGRTPLDVPVATFLLAAVLAALFSPNPSLSVLSSSLRGDGVLEYIVYAAAALTAARLGRARPERCSPFSCRVEPLSGASRWRSTMGWTSPGGPPGWERCPRRKARGH